MEFPSYQLLYDEVVTELSNEGLDDAGTIGSAANLIVNALLSRVTQIADRARRATSNSFTQNASGFYLDLHGEAHGLRRAGASPAFVLAGDRNLRIKATRGTLREKLGTSIPAGTTVADSTGSITYNISQATVPAGTTEMFLSAYATASGSSGNVGANVLTSLSVGTTDIEITNLYPIFTGRAVETDAVYRNRILNYSRGTQNGSAGELVSLATGVPGVIDARVLDQAFGISHPALMVVGTNRVRPGIVNRVEALIQEVLPLGTRIRVITPRYQELELSVIVEVEASANKPAVRNQVRQLITNRYGVHLPGSSLDLTEIDPQLTRAISSVKNVTIDSIVMDGNEFASRIIKTEPTDQIILSDLRVFVP